jgi:hypothetical protein
MPLTSIVFNAPETGEQRRVVRGHLHDGQRVLALDATPGGVAIVLEPGDIKMISTGSIVRVSESSAPAPRRAPSVQKQKPLVQTDPNGPVTGIVYHDGLSVRTLRVGGTVTDSSGRLRQVAAIIRGDPTVVVGLNGDVLFSIGLGSISRWS